MQFLFSRWFIIIQLTITANLQASSIAVECLGKKTAAQAVVYLHGLDGKQPSRQELDNRALLSQLATALDFRLVIARSQFTCKDQLCWPHNSPGEHKETYNMLKTAVANCTSSTTTPWGIVGFSNGGYFASKIVQYCYTDGPKWVVATGSAGSWAHTYHNDKAACPSLAVLIGDKDMTRDKAERYAKYLKSAGFNSSFSTFDGRHELKIEPLRSTLAGLLTRKI